MNAVSGGRTTTESGLFGTPAERAASGAAEVSADVGAAAGRPPFRTGHRTALLRGASGTGAFPSPPGGAASHAAARGGRPCSATARPAPPTDRSRTA
jgi:hypothetical protein